ncbi:MAG: hypothetical protein IPI81_10585 [Flavobacteriales bacterium]|nr:hypothetical protein [Flavobacteriales bacterium]MCC6939726.1 hypothetical protein [Flavobacteriales bacterium]
MDSARIKLSLIQRLQLIWDEAALLRVQKAIDAEIPTELADEDLTDEELVELNARRDAHLRGEGRSFTREEAMRLARAGFKQ